LFFSLSYVVFAFVLLVLVLRAFKNGWAALFFVFLHLIYAKALFFWPASDAMAAGSLAMLLFVWLHHKPVSGSGLSRFGRAFGITAVTVAVLFFHPFALVMVLFVLGFDVADARRIQPIHCLLAAVLLFVGMMRVITFSGYEIEGIRADWNIFNEQYMKQMARFYLENFSFGLVLLILLLIYYFAHKQPWKALVILVFTASHALAANVTHHLERQSPWYNLHLKVPLVFFVGAPFFGEVAKYLRSGWVAFLMLLMTAALGVSLASLKGPARDIRERHQVIESILTASARGPAAHRRA